jgi:hypothetical protein
MAKKVKVKKKGSKRLLSLIFHLVVLVMMVYLYDTARAMLGKAPLPPPPKVDAVPAKPSNKSGDGTFEKLMAEKRRKAKEGPEIPEEEKKEEEK